MKWFHKPFELSSLIHIGGGAYAGYLHVISWIFPLVLTGLVTFYEWNEAKYIGDKAFADLQEYLVGVFLIGGIFVVEKFFLPIGV